jgi:hypothetical protein
MFNVTELSILEFFVFSIVFWTLGNQAITIILYIYIPYWLYRYQKNRRSRILLLKTNTNVLIPSSKPKDDFTHWITFMQEICKFLNLGSGGELALTCIWTFWTETVLLGLTIYKLSLIYS